MLLRKFIPVAATCVLGLAQFVLPGCTHQGSWVQIDQDSSRFSREDQTTARHSPNQGLRIKSVAGTVTVREAPVSEVLIAYEVRAPTQEILDQTHVVADRDVEGTLFVRAEGPEPNPGSPRKWYAASLTITLPDAAWVDVDASSANIIVEGLGNPGAKRDSVIDTGSGNVYVKHHASHLVVDTGSGNVIVEGGVGKLNADTGSGDVTVTGRLGPLLIDTGSGDVQVTGVSDVFDIDTGSGDVVLRFAPDWSGRWITDTGSGEVRVIDAPAWDENAPQSIIDTGSGDVRIERLREG